MQFLESISSAVKSVLSHKMRSFLTMLGIIIGISSVIMITSIGDGVYNAIHNEIATFNMSTIQVFPRNVFGPSILTYNDMDAIQNLPNVNNVTTMIESNSNQRIQLRNPLETRRGSITGLDHNYHIIENINMLYGRFISENDINNMARVAVIRPEISIQVFGFVNSVGRTIYIEGNLGRLALTVVGIIDVPLDTIAAQSPPSMALALVPATTLSSLRNTPNNIDAMMVSMDNPIFATETAEQITRLLNIRHNREDGFAALSMTEVMDFIEIIFVGVTAFITFVAGISLFVGGVGVMNIMMVTVTERTREIGIRKSLGATGVLIRLQFVFESIVITLIGGILGIIFGIGSALALTIAVSHFSPMEIIATVDVTAIIIAVVSSILIGVIFGVYPAGKAANLDPVDSLRYE
ncbi:MAG: ABC transporter permease [Defluviitaleaceae bacterium]|nr:ABC transporter permease [Defluviitaleaceae bacterium]